MVDCDLSNREVERVMRFLRNILILLAVVCFSPLGFAQQQMRVPFNFQWGESAARVEQSLVGIKAKITERKVVEGRTVYVVEGIPQKQLQRALFYFRNEEHRTEECR